MFFPCSFLGLSFLPSPEGDAEEAGYIFWFLPEAELGEDTFIYDCTRFGMLFTHRFSASLLLCHAS